jgi:hypothetical protein
MSQYGIAQRGIRQPCAYRHLDGGHDLPRADGETRETEDAITVGLHQCF